MINLVRVLQAWFIRVLRHLHTFCKLKCVIFLGTQFTKRRPLWDIEALWISTHLCDGALKSELSFATRGQSRPHLADGRHHFDNDILCKVLHLQYKKKRVFQHRRRKPCVWRSRGSNRQRTGQRPFHPSGFRLLVTTHLQNRWVLECKGNMLPPIDVECKIWSAQRQQIVPLMIVSCLINAIHVYMNRFFFFKDLYINTLTLLRRMNSTDVT